VIERRAEMVRIGWKAVKAEEGKKVRLSSVLANLRSKTYENAEDLLKEVKPVKFKS
jgi:hypothetical protein